VREGLRSQGEDGGMSGFNLDDYVDVRHGTTAYRHGCRCAECREAHRVGALARRRAKGIGPRTIIALETRLWRKVCKTDECWLWTGSLDTAGYGLIRDGRKLRKVHRVAYELEVGPIDEGLHVDHLCRVRNCVNPRHLEAVTLAENMRRSRRTHCHAGHEFTAENTYWVRGCKTCAKERRRAA
jgi:hypothetical protein